MAAAAALGKQTGLGLARRPGDGDGNDGGNIFTRTLAALQNLATSLPTYVSRLPTKDILDARQRVLAQSGGSAEQISGPGGALQLQLAKHAGEGTFCVVFSGCMQPDGQANSRAAVTPIAVKLELRKVEFPQLRDEFRTYKLLHGTHGIPKVHYFGDLDFHKALVMDLLGPSLECYYVACGRRFSVKTVAMLAKQMLTRLQAVHEKGLLYRDVKPENFLIGVPGTDDVTTVYLVDFGMAKAYIDPATRRHIQPSGTRSLNGTVRYMSINAHSRQTQSRRDDIEALGHVLLYFVRGRLPWQGPRSEDYATRHERMLERKSATTIQDLCDGYPPEFAEYITYARGLAFDADPDYDYLRGLFSRVLGNLGTPDDGVYDWMPAPTPETKAKTADSASTPKISVQIPTTSSRKTQPLFYDSITQQALATLHRDIMAHRYKFHRGVGTVDVGRRGRVSGALRTTAAAATKVASAFVSGVAAHTASLPSNPYTRPLVQPITDFLASLTSDDGSSISSSAALPSVVIATSFMELLDQNLGKVTAELEDMCDKQLQGGDWTAGRTRVCGWVDEVAAAVPQEQERVRAEYTKWKETLQATKLPITDAQTRNAAPAVSQYADHGLRMDDGGLGSLEVDTLEVDTLRVDGEAKIPEPLVVASASILSTGDLSSPEGLTALPLGGNNHGGSDGDDSDDPDVMNLVFRTASGSRKVVRLNK